MRRVRFIVVVAAAACSAVLLALPRADAGAAAPSSFSLTVTLEAGTGTVSSSPGGINCPGACSAVFASGTPVTLTATPGAGFRFESWEESAGCTIQPERPNECRITLTFNIRVGVLFRPAATVHVFPNGAGAVTVSPPGLDLATGTELARCDSAVRQTGCRLAYRPGTRVTATAAPGSGRSFAGWGDARCGAGPCTVEAAAGETSLVATFNPLQLAVVISGSGTVASTPAGISCSNEGGRCAVDAPLGARFVLDAGTRPHEWRFGCDPENGDPRAARCTATAAALPTLVGVSFGGAGGPEPPDRISIRLDVLTSGGANVGVRGRKIDCRQPRCASSYRFGDMEELQPVDTPAARFERWINGCGTTRVCRFPVGPITSIEAVFAAPLRATLVRVVASGRGARRVVLARLGVNRPATVSLQLLRSGRRVAARTVALRPGQTTVRLPVPRGAAAGRYGFLAVVTAGDEQRRLSRTLRIGR